MAVNVKPGQLWFWRASSFDDEGCLIMVVSVESIEQGSESFTVTMVSDLTDAKLYRGLRGFFSAQYMCKDDELISDV